MTTLEKVLKLKESGIPENEIINKLKNEGISPMEINDAINQSKIKEAVSGEQENSTEGMVPSIMGGGENNSQEEEAYTPSPSPSSEEDYQDYAYQENQKTENYGPPSPENYSSEEYYQEEPPENYSGENYSMDSETMIEVAEQVFSEKIKKLKEDLNSLKEFKTLISPNIKDIDERLKRIEKQFDKMQIAILERVGEFGKNLGSIKSEIEMVEDSFEKMNKERRR